ncbi:MAG TPA: hypothetical protein VK923_15355 [Euzebyales bacterium]|nr:hypothetical protein [Euzebyales bacterium]
MGRLRIIAVALLTVFALIASTVGAGATTGTQARGVPTLREIRAAHHSGYDRLVFEFSGRLPDRTRVRWVERIVADPSGLPVRVAGDAFLEVSTFPVVAHNEDGTTTYGARRRAYDLPNTGTVVNSGDFEAVVSFGVGLMKKTSILRTMRLRHPSRYVIDIRTNFERTRVKTWFFDEDRFVANAPPFFRAVRRSVPVPAVARGALHRVYAGPTRAERRDGLTLLRSQSTGFTNLSVNRRRIARVQLTGGCDSGGSTVTVAGEIMPTLRQFPTVRWVKVYDPQGTTEIPTGRSDSIPACLEP